MVAGGARRNDSTKQREEIDAFGEISVVGKCTWYQFRLNKSVLLSVVGWTLTLLVNELGLWNV